MTVSKTVVKGFFAPYIAHDCNPDAGIKLQEEEWEYHGRRAWWALKGKEGPWDFLVATRQQGWTVGSFYEWASDELAG